MTEDKTDEVATGECGACRAVIPIDSEVCPECNISFSGVSDEALGECGACHGLVPLDSTKCTHCGTVFIADDVVDVLRNWLATTGITIPMLFKKFDTDGDGQIDSSELKTGLLSLNLADLPPSQVERLIETIDSDGDGRLDLAELHATITGEELTESELETLSSDSNNEESTKEAEDEASETDEQIDVDNKEPSEGDEEESSEEDSIEEESDEESTEHIEEDSTEEEPEEVDSEEKEALEDDLELGVGDEDEAESIPLIRRIADAMDEEGTSPNYFFSHLDRDADGAADVSELTNALKGLLDDEVSYDEIEQFLVDVDGDGDRRIDMFEFIIALEALDDADEALEEDDGGETEKPFPTKLQKSMMGKQWNDIVWPLMHLAFGLFIALLVLNAFGGIGPLSVDGTGGLVELEVKGTLIHQDGFENGDVYPCDPEYQVGDCKNSLTPFAGESSSMPAGFYWDGILFMVLGTGALIGSLYAHLILMATWRARSRAMKEVLDDQSDASEEAPSDNDAAEHDDEHQEDDSIEEEMDEVLEENFEEDELGEDEDSEEKSEGDPDEEIDIGSRIGLSLEDEEVYGKIIEFDDDEGTVTIKEDGSGEEITGYQDDIFLE